MDEVTREYLDAVNKLAEDTKPYSLYEEILGVDYIMALASLSKLVRQSVEEDAELADDFLYEFKRDLEINEVSDTRME